MTTQQKIAELRSRVEESREKIDRVLDLLNGMEVSEELLKMGVADLPLSTEEHVGLLQKETNALVKIWQDPIE